MSRFPALAMAAIIASSLPSFALADEHKRSINVANGINVTVVELYIAPIFGEGWGSNLLGSSYLHPGLATSVKLPGGFCRFDMLIMFQNGNQGVVSDIYLCHTDSLFLTRNHLVDVVPHPN